MINQKFEIASVYIGFEGGRQESTGLLSFFRFQGFPLAYKKRVCADLRSKNCHRTHFMGEPFEIRVDFYKVKA